MECSLKAVSSVLPSITLILCLDRVEKCEKIDACQIRTNDLMELPPWAGKLPISSELSRMKFVRANFLKYPEVS